MYKIVSRIPLTGYHILQLDLDKVISVRPGLLVENSEGVHQLVESASFTSQAIRAVFIWRLQRNDLGAPEFSNVRPTPDKSRFLIITLKDC